MTASPPEATVVAWAEAWRRLDVEALLDLFTADAGYVAAISGRVPDLRRAFSAAARTWRYCRLDDLQVARRETDGGTAVVGATYRFSGVTRHGREVAYAGAATFELRRDDGGRWRIRDFQESYARPMTTRGKRLDTL